MAHHFIQYVLLPDGDSVLKHYMYYRYKIYIGLTFPGFAFFQFCSSIDFPSNACLSNYS